MSIKSYLKEIHSGIEGYGSSKRVITTLSFMLITIGYFANLFFDYTVERFMFDSIMFIVIAGFGFTGIEKFAPKPPVKKENEVS